MGGTALQVMAFPAEQDGLRRLELPVAGVLARPPSLGAWVERVRPALPPGVDAALVQLVRDVVSRSEEAAATLMVRDYGLFEVSVHSRPRHGRRGPETPARASWVCAAYAFGFSPPVTAPPPTLMRLGCTSGFLGSTRLSTPSFRSAEMWSASTPPGSVKARLKLPKLRS